jgi:hypothetical protein
LQTPDEKRRPRDVEFTGCEIKRTYVDKGYRGHDAQNPRRVFTPGQENFGAIRRELRRRSAIEPVIGQHLNAQSSLLTDDQYREGLCKFSKAFQQTSFLQRPRMRRRMHPAISRKRHGKNSFEGRRLSHAVKQQSWVA